MQPTSHKSEGAQSENPPELNTNNIVKAFQIISSGGEDHTLISQADDYLFSCEANPKFLIALIDIFSFLNDSRSQWQILVHLKIVLKRNWSSKRRYYERVRLSEDIKE